MNRGAIEGFEEYIAVAKEYKRYKVKCEQRKEWIEALKNEKNPFTEKEISSLLNQ